MKNPKNRSTNPKRKPTNTHTDAELLDKFNALHEQLKNETPSFKGFSDDPSSRRTGWFFGGK